jgi:hypothetical protein
MSAAERQERELPPRLTLRGATFLGMGAMVGAGIFALLGQAGVYAGCMHWNSAPTPAVERSARSAARAAVDDHARRLARRTLRGRRCRRGIGATPSGRPAHPFRACRPRLGQGVKRIVRRGRPTAERAAIDLVAQNAERPCW